MINSRLPGREARFSLVFILGPHSRKLANEVDFLVRSKHFLHKPIVRPNKRPENKTD